MRHVASPSALPSSRPNTLLHLRLHVLQILLTSTAPNSNLWSLCMYCLNSFLCDSQKVAWSQRAWIKMRPISGVSLFSKITVSPAYYPMPENRYFRCFVQFYSYLQQEGEFSIQVVCHGKKQVKQYMWNSLSFTYTK